MAGTRIDDILTPELLERIRGRAAGYDRENAFFAEDLDELRDAGYLRLLVPRSLGGEGLSLVEASRAQELLAGAAPATALAVNMHLIWTGVALLLHDDGDPTLDFVLEGAARGEVFAFGVSEPGNDLVLFGSTTEAVPDADGGYAFRGRKIFTSLSPAWTSLGTMGLDTSSPDAPKLVYAFVSRDGGGFTIKDDWDTVGMRASQSRTTLLEGAHAPADRVVRRLDPGPNLDPLILGIDALFELFISSVYTGIARRALDLAADAARNRRSAANDGAPLSDDPAVRWRIAHAWIALEGVRPQIESLLEDVEGRVDHGMRWFPMLSGVKVRATETAREVVDAAVRVSGGAGYFSGSEIGRLYRDVLAGMFHPSNDDAAHASAARAVLGPIGG